MEHTLQHTSKSIQGFTVTCLRVSATLPSTYIWNLDTREGMSGS